MIEYLRKEYLKTSNIPKLYLTDKPNFVASNGDLDAYYYLQDIKNNIDNFVSSGNNIFIYSKCTGNGKTTWATKLLRAYIDYASDYNYPGYNAGIFVNVAELISLKKLSMDKDEESKSAIIKLENNIRKAPVVVWDDIAIRGLSEYDQEYLYSLINNRVANLKSNIYTANVTPTELESQVGARLYSRIINQSTLIEFKGSDKRSVPAN